MIAIVLIVSFFCGMAFRQFLTWLERPKVTKWGESTRYWSDVDWEWYRRRQE